MAAGEDVLSAATSTGSTATRSRAGSRSSTTRRAGRPDDNPSDPFAGGTRLQLPVYLLAAQGAPARASYWYISSRGGFERVGCDSGPDTDARFAATIGAVADGVAAGSFPAVPGEFSEHWVEFANCGHCDFTRICTRGRGERLRRKYVGGPSVHPQPGRTHRCAPTKDNCLFDRKFI